MTIFWKLLDLLKKKPKNEKKDIEKYVQKIRRSKYQKETKVKAEKVFLKIMTLDQRYSPAYAYKLCFLNELKHVQDQRKLNSKRSLKKKRNGKK